MFRKQLPARWTSDADTASLNLADRPGTLLTHAKSVQLHLSDRSRREVRLPASPAPVTDEGTWELEFPTLDGSARFRRVKALASWTEDADPAVRHYSGTAIYRTSFDLPQQSTGAVAILDLGRVTDIARVEVNGHDAGIAWKPPLRLDVTPYLHPGTNRLEIHVANRWIDRLIGDEAIAVDVAYQETGTSPFTDGRLLTLPDWLYRPGARREWPRSSFTTWKHYEADSPLVPTGLLGPVRIEWWQPIPNGDEAS